MTRLPLPLTPVAPPPERAQNYARQFRLPTVAAEVVPRFLAAGHEAALGTLADVFELEAEDRKGRRVDRLRQASHLPPGKTFDTLDTTRFPRQLMGRLHELARGDFVDQAENVLAFGLPGWARATPCAP